MGCQSTSPELGGSEKKIENEMDIVLLLAPIDKKTKYSSALTKKSSETKCLIYDINPNEEPREEIILHQSSL